MVLDQVLLSVGCASKPTAGPEADPEIWGILEDSVELKD